MIDLKYLTEEVKKLAEEAGKFLLSEREKFDRNKVLEKNSHDYVSYVDKESEKFLVKRLSALLPEAGFIAEEGTASLQDQEYCWVIDPLDGTTNFIHNNPPFCVSIALRNREELLIGVVYEACRAECFWTYKGENSYLNDQIIKVSDISDLNHSFIELGFPYNFKAYKHIARNLIDLLYGNVGGLRLQGSAAAEPCYVACGRFEARVEAYLGPWDVAAGAIILMNAGGVITDFDNGSEWINGKEAIATNGKIHGEMIEVIKKALKQ